VKKLGCQIVTQIGLNREAKTLSKMGQNTAPFTARFLFRKLLYLACSCPSGSTAHGREACSCPPSSTAHGREACFCPPSSTARGGEALERKGGRPSAPWLSGCRPPWAHYLTGGLSPCEHSFSQCLLYLTLCRAVGKRDISAWEIYCEIVLTRSGLITRRLKNRR